jgi:hypothetical protein
MRSGCLATSARHTLPLHPQVLTDASSPGVQQHCRAPCLTPVHFNSSTLTQHALLHHTPKGPVTQSNPRTRRRPTASVGTTKTLATGARVAPSAPAAHKRTSSAASFISASTPPLSSTQPAVHRQRSTRSTQPAVHRQRSTTSTRTQDAPSGGRLAHSANHTSS